MEKACEVKWNVDKQRWTDAEGILDSYEQDGKFYWTDGSGFFETSELIDLDEVFFDEYEGFIYHDKKLDEYVINEA